MTLTRLKRLDEALGEFRRAAELEPDQARYAYVYAVALHSAGRGNEAMTALKESLARHPDDRDTLLALISFSREAGDPGPRSNTPSGSQDRTERSGVWAGLIQELRRSVNKPDAL